MPAILTCRCGEHVYRHGEWYNATWSNTARSSQHLRCMAVLNARLEMAVDAARERVIEQEIGRDR